MGMKNMPLVLYGAGKYAAKALKYVREQGYMAACFCDSDSTKQGKDYLGLPVYSVDEVKAKFIEFNVFVSIENFHTKCEVFICLLENGVNKERIINHEEFELATTCHSLESFMCVVENRLTHCCYSGEEKRLDDSESTPGVEMSTDMEESVLRFIKDKNELKRKFQTDEIDATICFGCGCLVKQYQPVIRTPMKLSTINFAFNSPCQLSCYYCRARNAKNKFPPERDLLIKQFDYSKLFAILKSHNLIDENLHVLVATGEIALLPNKNCLLNEIHSYNKNIYTNAVIFDEAIANQKNINMMSVSPDAGTAATYLKVKGMDAFLKVWENIKAYVDKSIDVVAKYIFLPENSNAEDVEGFIENVRKAGVNKIEISADMCRDNYNNTEIVEFILLMIKLCDEYEIKYSIGEGAIGSQNMKLINSALEDCS